MCSLHDQIKMNHLKSLLSCLCTNQVILLLPHCPSWRTVNMSFYTWTPYLIFHLRYSWPKPFKTRFHLGLKSQYVTLKIYVCWITSLSCTAEAATPYTQRLSICLGSTTSYCTCYDRHFGWRIHLDLQPLFGSNWSWFLEWTLRTDNECLWGWLWTGGNGERLPL